MAQPLEIKYRPIPGAPGYEAGSDGTIRSLRREVTKTQRGTEYKAMVGGRVLKPWIAGYGYHYVLLGAGGQKGPVHKFVCMAFHGERPEGKEVAHLDGDCLNNSAANLAWVTHSENEKHKQAHGTAPDYGSLRWGRA